MCTIYDLGLHIDFDATAALPLYDNLNAGVQMGECEMQGFGCVHEVVGRHPDDDYTSTGDRDPARANEIITSLQVRGLDQCDTSKMLAATGPR